MNSRTKLEEILSREVAEPKSPLIEAVRALSKERPIVVYGAGLWGVCILKLLKGIHPIAYFTDRNSDLHGKSIFDVEVLSPKEVAARCSEIPFVVTSPLSAELPEVWEDIQNNLSFIPGLTPNDIHRYNLVKDWATMRYRFIKYWHEYRNNIIQLYDLLGDEYSRDVLVEWMRSGFEYDKFSKKYECESCYFHKDLFNFVSGEIIVDCGAYIGDTVHEAMYQLNVERIFAFEPDPGNFKKLEEMCSKYVGKVTCINAAVGEREGTLRFQSNASGNENVSAGFSSEDTGFSSEDIDVRVCAIDDVIHDSLPTLIKMDIEGSEYSALLGAANLIRKARPVLAICLYHKPEDPIVIPAWINENLHDYTFHLRKAEDFDSYHDFVLFCVPSERKVLS